MTAVWSPAGGCDKTSVALANAAKMTDNGKKKSVYLDLEAFSSIPVYFNQSGKKNSLSAALSNLNGNGNLSSHLQGIRQLDSGSEVFYFGAPDNYDDVAILGPKEIEELIQSCVINADELVIDLSCEIDSKVKKIFELADNVVIVIGNDSRNRQKLEQFVSQNSIFQSIEEKVTLVANFDAEQPNGNWNADKVVTLPHLNSSNDPIAIYKALSAKLKTL